MVDPSTDTLLAWNANSEYPGTNTSVIMLEQEWATGCWASLKLQVVREKQ